MANEAEALYFGNTYVDIIKSTVIRMEKVNDIVQV